MVSRQDKVLNLLGVVENNESDVRSVETLEAGVRGRARILELSVENVRKIALARIDEFGEVHQIRGDENQGKTTILDAIAAVFTGIRPEMVSRDADRAAIRLKLSEADITRVLSKQDEGWKETVLATDAAGKTIKAKDVQSFLRTICNGRSFDPLQWVLLASGPRKGEAVRLREQRDQLLMALPVTLTADEIVEAVKALGDEVVDAFLTLNLDDIEYDQAAYSLCEAFTRVCRDRYTVENAMAADAENRLELVPAPSRIAPKDTVEVLKQRETAATREYHAGHARSQGYTASMERAETLRGKIEELEKTAPERSALERTTKAHNEKYEGAKFQIEALEKQLKAQRDILDQERTALGKCAELKRTLEALEASRADLKEIEDAIAAESAPVDLSLLKRAMDEASADVEARRAQDAYEDAARTAVTARASAEQFTQLKKLFEDTLPKRLLVDARLPVPGLAMDGDRLVVDWDGEGAVPLSEVGTSRKIRIGIVVWAALNPRCAFVPIDRAESIGRQGWVELAEIAHEMGLQIIATVVDAEAVPGPGVTVMRGGAAVGTTSTR